MAAAKRIGPGRPAIAITKAVLKKLEKLGASGLNQRWAAQALGMSEDTFGLRRQDNPDFSAAWRRGRAAYAMMIASKAPAVIQGLLKNATTKTKGAPGGNVAAQLGFLEKVVRKTDGDEIQGYVNPDELGGIGPSPQEGQGEAVEIQEVRVRRIRRVGTGRIEDEA